MQARAEQKKTPQDLLLLCRAQPILSKDSASERKAKENSAGFAFALPSAAYLMKETVTFNINYIFHDTK